MGTLSLFQGSAHVYKPHWESALEWTKATEIDLQWLDRFPHGWTDPTFDTREDMLQWMRSVAADFQPAAKT
jgi:hypothetical protein